MTRESRQRVFLDVIEYCQHPDFPTGCESIALYLLLKYYGAEVTPEQIVDLLPKGPQPFQDEAGQWHGANPERQFVGDPRSAESFGVFNRPIAQVAEHFLPGVQTTEGASLDDVMAILDSGNPVVVWYVIEPQRKITYRCHWLDERGETIRWPSGEHAVVVCGYDDDNIFYRDPNTGGTRAVSFKIFDEGFRQLGGRIVYYLKSSQAAD